MRYGKATIGGISIAQAISEQYKGEDGFNEEEKQNEREREKQNLIVTTNKEGGMKQIEVKGIDKAYAWRANVGKSKDITLQFQKISELGPPGTIQSLIPTCMNLYLDKNFLYSWDQFFQITAELSNLRVLVLTGNRFRRIDKTYFDGKIIDQMVPLHLNELVLIDMNLDWSQIDILSPTLHYVE